MRDSYTEFEEKLLRAPHMATSPTTYTWEKKHENVFYRDIDYNSKVIREVFLNNNKIVLAFCFFY